MIEHNANRFWSVYEKAEQLFEKLTNVGSEFEVNNFGDNSFSKEMIFK